MADKKLTEVDVSSTIADNDKLVGNIGNSVKQITLTNLVNIIKNKIGSLKNPHALTFTGAVNDTYDGSSAKTINIPTVSGGGGETSANIPRQEMQNTNTTVTLQPNILYVFPEMTTLTVTLATPSESDIANEFHWVFDSGNTACVFSLQNQNSNPIYTDTYSIEANTRYEVSVLEDIAYIKGVSNAT